jgi:hypothetical protein
MRITRKDFFKTGATAIAACIGLGETRCSDDEASPAQSPGGAAGRGGSSGTGGSAGTAGISGSADAQGSAGSGGGQSGTGASGGSGATEGLDAGADAPNDGADASGGSAGSAGSAGTTGSAGSPSEGGVCSNVNVDIETDHPHDLVIPSADILAGVAKSYRMTGDHDHTVTMRAVDFERLRAGELVETISSDDDGHTHLVEIRCV